MPPPTHFKQSHLLIFSLQLHLILTKVPNLQFHSHAVSLICHLHISHLHLFCPSSPYMCIFLTLRNKPLAFILFTIHISYRHPLALHLFTSTNFVLILICVINRCYKQHMQYDISSFCCTSLISILFTSYAIHTKRQHYNTFILTLHLNTLSRVYLDRLFLVCSRVIVPTSNKSLLAPIAFYVIHL